jgi:hypothetical protein
MEDLTAVADSYSQRGPIKRRLFTESHLQRLMVPRSRCSKSAASNAPAERWADGGHLVRASPCPGPAPSSGEPGVCVRLRTAVKRAAAPPGAVLDHNSVAAHGSRVEERRPASIKAVRSSG